jgi:capping protein beta
LAEAQRAEEKERQEEELKVRIKMRNLLSSVYFGKTKDVINDLRSQAGLEAKSNEDKLRAELAGRLGGRKVKA